MSLFPRRLGARLTIFLVILLGGLGVAAASVVFAGFRQSESNASQASREGIEDYGADITGIFALLASESADLSLVPLEQVTQSAADYLAQADRLGASFPTGDLETTFGGVRYNPEPGRASDVWLPAGLELTSDVEQELARSALLDALLPGELARHDDARAAYFIAPSGLTRYYPPADLHTVLPPDHSPTEAPVFQRAAPEQNPDRDTIWTAPHEDPAHEGLLVSVASPVYVDDEFVGIVGVDLALEVLISNVDLLRPSPNGYAFLIDAEGNLLPGRAQSVVEEALDDPVLTLPTGRVLAAMRSGQFGVERLTLGGDDVVVGYAPLDSLGGSVALVAPMDDITEQAGADLVAESITQEGRRTLATIGIVIVILFAGAVLVGSYMTRRLLVRPIDSLVSATGAVAAGDLQTAIPVARRDELGDLAVAFNNMTGRLAAREHDLRKETADRQRAEQELNAVFAAMSDIVVVLDRAGTYLRVAPSGTSLLVEDPQELTGHKVHDFFPPEQAQAFLDCIARALEEQSTQLIEYQVPGQPRWFLGAVSPMDGDRVVWVARDITERVQSRQLLEQAVDERTRELSTLVDVSHNTASNLDVSSLVDTLLGQLAQVVAFDSASVLVLEGDRLVVLDSRAFDERETDLIGSRMHPERFGVIWDRLRDGHPVLVDDIHGPGLEARAYREGLPPDVFERLSTYMGSWMAIPMQTRDRIVGVLSVSRSQQAYFHEHHADLASAFANFAAIAIDNARLFSEAQRHIRQNNALARVTSNLQFVELLEDNLDALARDIVEAANVVACSIILTTETAPFFGKAGQYGLPNGYLAGMRQSWERGAMLVGRADFRFGQPVVISGARTRLQQDPGFAPLRPVVADVRWEDVVTAPIAVNGEIAGAVNFFIESGEPATNEDITFSQAVAAQVSIVVSNAALFQQSERRAHDLEVILTAADRLSGTLEIDPLIEIALDQMSLIAPHDGEGVYLLDEDDIHIYLRHAAGRPGDSIGAPIPRTAAGAMLERVLQGEVLTIDDVYDDVYDDDGLASEYLDLTRRAGLGDSARDLRSFLCVPLVVSGRTIGALSLASRSRAAFDDRHRRVAQGIAYQMAVAFENARLFSETLKRERENWALASVASALTLDQPVAATLDAIARGIVQTTDAVACSVTLQSGDGEYVLGGTHGLPEGFIPMVGEAMALGALTSARDVFQTGTPRILRDARDRALRDDRYSSTVHDMLRSASWQHIAIFPLIYRGKSIGNLATYFPPEVHIDDDLVALLGSIAGQAAFAVENARLFDETVRRDRENRALAGVASALALDQPIGATLDAIASRVVENTDAIACGVTLLDERGEYLLGGDVGLPEGFPEAMVESISIGAPSAVYDVMRTGTPQVHAGLKGYFDERPHFAPIAALMHDAPWDNVAIVPLGYRSRVIGSLSTFYPPEIVPGEDELALLRAIAGQAALAAENARLFTEMEQHAVEMETLYRADEELYRSLDLAHVFQALVDVAVDVLGCDTSVLFRWEPSSPALVLAAHRGFTPATIARAEEMRPAGSLRDAIASQDIICIEDATSEPGVNRHLPLAEGIRSHMHVPILIGDTVIGIFNVGYRRPHSFTAEERRLGMALSQRAAIAIQNARLYEQAQQAASLQERQRIARDLHDSVSQALYGIGLGATTALTLLDRDPAAVAQPLDYILSLSEAGLAELRALIFELRPDSLATDGLVAALERQVAALRARHKLDVDAEFPPEPDIPLEAKEALYRVAQEAMTNAVKHARASRLVIRLEHSDGRVELSVADDGVGFDPDSGFPGHMGLKSMHERVNRLGGAIKIASSPGAGTTITVAIPLSA